MEFCKNCRNLPICSYSENEYILPDVFDITCSFYQPLYEAVKASQSEENVSAEESTEEDDRQAEIEENQTETLKEVIQEQIDSLDDSLPDLDEGAGRYPAKKKGRKSKKEKVMELFEKMKPEQIAKELKMELSDVKWIIEEELNRNNGEK